jgi:hypothetical protein
MLSPIPRTTPAARSSKRPTPSLPGLQSALTMLILATFSGGGQAGDTVFVIGDTAVVGAPGTLGSGGFVVSASGILSVPDNSPLASRTV